MMRKHGPKVFGLCMLAALGVMAFASASAQASPGAFWELLNQAGQLVKIGVPNDTLLPSLGASLENNHGVLLTKVAGITVEILCTAMTLEEAKLLLEGKLLGKIKFSGCKIKLNGVVSAPCEPHTGAEKGVILTLRLKGLIELHTLAGGEKHHIVKFLDDKEPFPNTDHFVTIELSEECAIGERLPVFGTFSAKECNIKEFLTHLVNHLWEEFKPLTELWVISNTAEHKATVDGSALVFLTGEHMGLKWGGTTA